MTQGQKEQIEPRRVLECRNRKTRPLSSFPLPCFLTKTISVPPGQYNLSPLLPHGEKVFATQYTCLIQSTKDPQDPYPSPCTLGKKSGLRTAVQCPFSLELAHCSNSVFHSNKLYFPFIVSHVEILFQPVPGPRHFWWPVLGAWGLFPTYYSLLLFHRDPL